MSDNNNEINIPDEYDSLQSYEGGHDFFELVLGGLAKLQHKDSDSDTHSVSSYTSSSSSSSNSSNSSKNSGSSKSSNEINPMFESTYEKSGGDKQSYVYEDSPYISTIDMDEENDGEDFTGGDADISEILQENIPDLLFQSQEFVINGGHDMQNTENENAVFEESPYELYGGYNSDNNDSVEENDISPFLEHSFMQKETPVDNASDTSTIDLDKSKKKTSKDIKKLIKNMIISI